MNRFGFPEDYWSIQEYKDFIEDTWGEQGALLDKDIYILVEKISNTNYCLSTDDEDLFFSNLDDLFNAKVINGKCINDFEKVDYIDN